METYNFIEGAALLIDKPLEWTSFDVVNKLRYALRKALGIKKIKVGHAGTLDPLATGLLIVCTGKFTKCIDEYQALYKVYEGTLQLGATTPSYDAEMAIDEQFPTQGLQEAAIHQAAQAFTGTIQQVPPMFSAVKVDGQPLYKKARKGATVRVKSREVTVDRFDITAIHDNWSADFEVQCSKGTYIRSLAHDLGKHLNNGAYLTRLRRTQIGEYHVKDAWELDDLIEHIKANYQPPSE